MSHCNIICYAESSDVDHPNIFSSNCGSALRVDNPRDGLCYFLISREPSHNSTRLPVGPVVSSLPTIDTTQCILGLSVAMHAPGCTLCTLTHTLLFVYLPSQAIMHMYRTIKSSIPRVLHLLLESVVFLLSHHPRFACVIRGFLRRARIHCLCNEILKWFKSKLYE